MAITCAKQGMNLVLVARRKDLLQELSEMLRAKYQVAVSFLPLDLSHDETPSQIFDYCTNQDLKINTLINNAGIGYQGKFKDNQLEYYDALVKINITSMVKLTRLFLPEMMTYPSSHILNVGSMASFFPIPNKAAYAASKSFIYSFSQALREELKDSSVNVSILCPGGVITNDRIREKVTQMSGLKRKSLQMPDEVAQVAIKKLMRGKFVIIPGFMNKVMYVISRLIPKEFHAKLAGKVID